MFIYILTYLYSYINTYIHTYKHSCQRDGGGVVNGCNHKRRNIWLSANGREGEEGGGGRLFFFQCIDIQYGMYVCM